MKTLHPDEKPDNYIAVLCTGDDDDMIATVLLIENQSLKRALFFKDYYAAEESGQNNLTYKANISHDDPAMLHQYLDSLVDQGAEEVPAYSVKTFGLLCRSWNDADVG
jgi:hypothetical protein